MMQHRSLCLIGERFLRRELRVPVTAIEVKSTLREVPDVFGASSLSTFILEAKASRSDFIVDIDKPFRKNMENGVGDYRYYICPESLIDVSELPDKWGLIWVDELGRATLKYGYNPTQRMPWDNGDSYEQWRIEHDITNDQSIMYSLLRRAVQRGVGKFGMW